ncbi:YqgE/AlgH family protein [Sediminibacterium sp.]|uniref:YqgE/AlgH family protein n=1 Tax=Sediminibacterium sp. TaxID=1917865 RepID=UPI0025F95466|nr:YqgE/AlgH family protein [Sediminibacterium sp.]MBW0179282.1 YqgE/AlgH family protein [Sediminibacterium sp.]
MSSLLGTIITSTPDINDPNFENTPILIVEHNDRGAVGFIAHLPLMKNLNELAEFTQYPPVPLFIGGPVDQENLFFLHRRPDLIEGGLLIKDGVYYGGDFQQVLAHLKDQTLAEKDIRLLIGYAGWDPQQLEEEIKEGSWVITNQPAFDAFD